MRLVHLARRAGDAFLERHIEPRFATVGSPLSTPAVAMTDGVPAKARHLWLPTLVRIPFGPPLLSFQVSQIV